MWGRQRQQQALFGNTIVPSSVGAELTTGSTSQVGQPNTRAYTRGPNPEPFLQTGESKDPLRGRAPKQTTQPRIPTLQPWATSSVYVQNNKQSTGQPRNQVAPAPYQSQLKSLAPPMITQRDTIWDDADYNRTQWRFHLAFTPSQMYFNQKAPLPEFTTPARYIHGVQAGEIPGGMYPSEMRHGWSQNTVPAFIPRQAEVGDSPPWLLSTPLNVKQRTYSAYDTTETRRPLKTHAPKRIKSAQ